MQISALFAYCSGRNFYDSDLPLISKCGTRLILGCVIGLFNEFENFFSKSESSFRISKV